MNREEWLAWRHHGIGGSDAPIVMGVSEFKTPLQLFEDKILPAPPEHKGNFVTDRGDRYEPKIRDLYNLMTNRDFKPALYSHPAFPFLKVSLDGEDGDDIIEIKTAGRDDHANCKLGKIPDKYYPQIQHELMVSGKKRCHYLSYWDPDWFENNVVPSNLEVVTIEPNYDYWETLLAREVQFWDAVQKKKPPLPNDRDFKQVKGHAKLATLYKRLKLKHSKLADDLEAARIALIEAAKSTGHPRCAFGDLKATMVSRVGNVNYKAIPELKDVDLEKYRGKGTISWRLGTDAGDGG